MSSEVSRIKVAPVIETGVKKRVERPKRYKVLLINDDYTPMDFVVLVLRQYFFKPHEVAVQIMFEIHQKGIAVCGVYTVDVAETKVALVNGFARQHEHPLLCKMEEVDIN